MKLGYEAAFLLLLFLYTLPIGANVIYGTLTWQRDEFEFRTIHYHLTLAYINLSPTPVVGTLILLPSQFSPGDDNLFEVQAYVTEVQNHPRYGPIATAQAHLRHRYLYVGEYTASIQVCCRPSTQMASHPGSTMRLQTRVNAQEGDNNNYSPRVSALPAHPLRVSPIPALGISFRMLAVDTQGDSLYWRMATIAESNGVSPPPGMTVASNGLVTWVAASDNTAGLTPVQFHIADRPDESGFHGKAVLDVCFDFRVSQFHCHSDCDQPDTPCAILGGTCTNCGVPADKCVDEPPQFLWPSPTFGEILNGDPCSPVFWRLFMDDNTLDENFSVFHSAYPTGQDVFKDKSHSAWPWTVTDNIFVTYTSGSNPFYQRYAWHPYATDRGDYVFWYTVMDKNGRPANDPVAFILRIHGEPCNNRGACVNNEYCSCFGNYDGASCESCKPGWYGDRCSQTYGGPVWGMGLNTAGQLAQNPSNYSIVETAMEVTGANIVGRAIQHLAVGLYHTVVSDDEGLVFSWGSNGQRQLGAVDELNDPIPDSYQPVALRQWFALDPEELLTGPYDHILNVTAGDFHSMALSNESSVYHWGTVGYPSPSFDHLNWKKPRNITRLIGCMILKDIQLGGATAMGDRTAGDTAMTCYEWCHTTLNCGYWEWTSGTQQCRQFNKNDNLDVTHTTLSGTWSGTVLLVAWRSSLCQLDAVIVIKSGPSTNYAIANTTSGTRVYSWGLNDYGQLATGDTEWKGFPWEITDSFSGNIVDIFPGDGYTFFLDDANGLWAIGDNTHGQLCLDTTVHGTGTISTLTQVDPSHLDDDIIYDVATAYRHTWIQTNGTLFACGANDWGQLGLGWVNTTGDDYDVPVNVSLHQWIGSQTVLKFAVGGNHTAFLTETHDVYTLGDDSNGQLGRNEENYTVPELIEDTFDALDIQDVQAGYQRTMMILQNEDFDPGRTQMECYPLIAGYPTNCCIKLYDVRGNAFGTADHVNFFKILNIRGGDGNEICPPPDDRPNFVKKGEYCYIWKSPKLGRGGRFKVSFMDEVLLAYNNSAHNFPFNDFNEQIHGWNHRTPWRSPAYVDYVINKRKHAVEDELYLNFYCENDLFYSDYTTSNLIQNPSAEDNPTMLDGWTETSGAGFNPFPITAPPTDWGAHVFALTGAPYLQGATASIEQVVNLTDYASTIDLGAQMFDFSVRVRSLGDSTPDTARAVVEYTDGNATLLTYDSGYQSVLYQWGHLQDKAIVPPGVREARITLYLRNEALADVTAYMDEVVLRPTTIAGLETSQVYALQELYTALDGPNWINKDNWLTGQPCINFWQGVTCTLHTVTSIELRYNQLDGTIPDSIMWLQDLLLLNLEGNSIDGDIPRNLTLLPKLRELHLARNNLTGIPETLPELTCLAQLTASKNQIQNIPLSIGDMWRLVKVDLSANAIDHQIPDLTHMIRLESLQLHRNKIIGTIPETIGYDAYNLTELDIAHNLLNSTLPISLGNFSRMHTLQLNHNYIYGPIPDELQTMNLTNLQLLLDHNSLTGVIPNWIQNVRVTWLAHNNFTCPIPDFDNIHDHLMMECSAWPVYADCPGEVERARINQNL